MVNPNHAFRVDTGIVSLVKFELRVHFTYTNVAELLLCDYRVKLSLKSVHRVLVVRIRHARYFNIPCIMFFSYFFGHYNNILYCCFRRCRREVFVDKLCRRRDCILWGSAETGDDQK